MGMDHRQKFLEYVKISSGVVLSGYKRSETCYHKTQDIWQLCLELFNYFNSKRNNELGEGKIIIIRVRKRLFDCFKSIRKLTGYNRKNHL